MENGIKPDSLSSMISVVERYPWYQPAIKRLLLKMAADGTYASHGELLKRIAIHFYSRSLIYKVANGKYREKAFSISDEFPIPEELRTSRQITANESGSESEASLIVRKQLPSATPDHIAGGDYFKPSELESVDNKENRWVIKRGEFNDALTIDLAASDNFTDEQFYTETLAKIYADQGLSSRAIDVYSKLILLYPKKNAYFAGLINDLKSKNN